MRKLAVSVFFVVVVLALTGCPRPLPNIESDQPIQSAQTGTIEIKGDLNALINEKAFTYSRLQEIGAALAARVSQVSIMLQDVDGNHYPVDAVVVQRGLFQQTVYGIEPGLYNLSTDAYDADGYRLFSSSDSVKVIAGQTSSVRVLENLLPQYPFQAEINHLAPHIAPAPAVSVRLVSATTTYYPGWWSGDPAQLKLNLYLNLPLDFDGGTLVIELSDGQVLQTDLPLKVYELDFAAASFSFNDVYQYVYAPSQDLGNVDVSVGLNYSHAIVANGRLFDSLQQAVNECDSPVAIQLGSGDYPGFSCYDPKVVQISGLGAIETRITGALYYQNSNQSYAIMYDQSQGGYGKGKSAAKGGGPYLGLSNLTVQGGAALGKGGGSASETDAALIVGWANLEMSDVIVQTENNGLYSYYDSGIDINHCTFIGTSAGLALKLDYHADSSSESGDYLINSIVYGFATGIDVMTDINGPIHATYDCIYACSNVADYDIEVSTFILKDPLFGPDYTLLSGSPCINAGNDGENLGVRFRG